MVVSWHDKQPHTALNGPKTGEATMRAAVIRSYNADLSLETVPDPICEADGVVLRVLSCGICRSDWHGWVGEHPKVQLGAIPGHEYCGEVVETGPLAKWRLGWGAG